MFSLDLSTAYLMAGLMCVMSGVATFAMRGLHEPSSRATTIFAAGLMVGGASMMFANLADPWLPGSTIRLVGAIANAAAILLGLEGVRQLDGHPPRMLLATAALAFVAIVHALAPDRHFSVQWHVLVQAACSIIAIAYLCRASEAPSRLHRMALIGSFACLATAALARWIVVTRHPELAVLARGTRLDGVNAWAMLLFVVLPPVQSTLIQGITSKRQVALLSHQASTDELTGASSRRFLFSRAEAWLGDGERRHPYTALLMIDVDNFKSVNDRFGHLAGDQVLRHVAQVLQGALRRDSLLARYGGEEFCALVPVADEQEARDLADRLRRSVETAHYDDGTLTIGLTVSIGVALHRAGLTLHDVLRAADRRVYEAKTQGRNRVIADDPRLQSAIV
ncbi:MAG: GGDEF domain-containing protein [Burkholderiaceae bacterium]